jgi:hypothetical protein
VLHALFARKTKDGKPIRVINGLQLDGLPHDGVMAEKTASEIGFGTLD